MGRTNNARSNPLRGDAAHAMEILLGGRADLRAQRGAIRDLNKMGIRVADLPPGVERTQNGKLRLNTAVTSTMVEVGGMQAAVQRVIQLSGKIGITSQLDGRRFEIPTSGGRGRRGDFESLTSPPERTLFVAQHGHVQHAIVGLSAPKAPFSSFDAATAQVGGSTVARALTSEGYTTTLTANAPATTIRTIGDGFGVLSVATVLQTHERTVEGRLDGHAPIMIARQSLTVGVSHTVAVDPDVMDLWAQEYRSETDGPDSTITMQGLPELYDVLAAEGSVVHACSALAVRQQVAIIGRAA